MAAYPEESKFHLNGEVQCSESEVREFVNDMISGKLNHLSGYLLERFEGEDAREFLECDSEFVFDNLFYSIVSGILSLRNYRMLDFFLGRYKSEFFDHWLFENVYDFREGLDYLLEKGANINLKNVLKSCCKTGNVVMMKHILEDLKFDNIVDFFPMFSQNGVDKQKRDEVYSMIENLIILCIENRKVKCLKYLLSFGVHINRANLLGQSYLHLAVEKRNPKKLIVCLLDFGIDRDHKDNNGKKAIDYPFYEYHDSNNRKEILQDILQNYCPEMEMKEPDVE